MYTLKQLSLMSGLTERTLRNYLKMGILHGEKCGGIWYFDIAEIESFFENPFVSEAMKSNRKSIVFDHLKSNSRDKNRATVILDLPEDKSMSVATFFCDAVNRRTGLTMTFDRAGGVNRVILSGEETTVVEILDEYRTKKQM